MLFVLYFSILHPNNWEDLLHLLLHFIQFQVSVLNDRDWNRKQTGKDGYEMMCWFFLLLVENKAYQYNSSAFIGIHCI